MSAILHELEQRMPPTEYRAYLRDVSARRSLVEYSNDPAGFVSECIDWGEGGGPTPYQLEVLGELPARRRLAIRSPHGSGKTTLAACLVLWFALTRDASAEGDWKVVTTASAWRQLTHYL